MNDWNYAEWAERAAIENLRGRLATGDFLLGQANTLLSITLLGIGGAMSFGAKVVLPAAGPVAWGACAVALWLCVVGAALTLQCIATRTTPALFNEPGNLYRPDLHLTELEIRQFEMQNIQGRIGDAKVRNARIARWLDRCRYAVVATPLIFAAAALAVGR